MLTLLLAVLALVSTSLQDDGLPSKAQLCVGACQSSFDTTRFRTTDPEDRTNCKDTLRWESVWLCSKIHCSPRQIKVGTSYAEQYCKDVSVLSYDTVVANFSDEAIKNIPILQYSEKPSKHIVNNTLLPSQELFDLAYRTWDVHVKVAHQNDDFSYAMYGFWGIILLFGMGNRLFALIVTRSLGRRHDNSSEAISERRLPASKSSFGIFRRLVRRYITLPATFGYRHQQPFGLCTLPTRLQSLMIFLYVGLNIILSSVKYSAFPHNLYRPKPSIQIWTYVTDRTGILAVANLPLLWVFAGRNDVFLWLTGWNFATFNLFHRWIARIVAVEAVIHSIGYTFLTLKHFGREGLAEHFKEQYWYCGVIATICFSFLLLFSMYPIRQKNYELFLALHVGFAVTALVTIYYHTVIWDGKFEPFIWPCVAVWSFDHFVRMMRLAVLNYKVAFLRHTKVFATYNQEHDIIRLTFTPSYHRQPTPGTHYYLHFPFILKAIGNSPFTMSGWSFGGKQSPTSSVLSRSVSKDQEKGNISPTAFEVDSDSRGSQEQDIGDMKIHFVLKPYKGLTAKLRDSIVKTGTGCREITAMMEGPYGEAAPVFQYNTVIFVVGGSGISAALPYMQEYLHPSSSHVSRSTTTKRVHILWSSRSGPFVRDVVDSELAAASTNPYVKLDLYVTGSAPSQVKNDTLDLDRFPGGIDLRYERPDVKRILHQEVGDSVGTVAIFVCGPATLADDARRAAVELVGAGKDGIGYFEEQFGW